MNYNHQKLDASLAIAMTEARDTEAKQFVVFIQIETPLNAAAIAFLEDMGVQNLTPSRKIHTAALSPEQVAALSQQTWVRYIRLSQKLQLS
ncbi:MAG: hypothetical protein F6K32_18300 [Desertifilum sp. SIO1I2]|nr:hypothetical protein [Desertifilum sp. SIO1I2]